MLYQRSEFTIDDIELGDHPASQSDCSPSFFEADSMHSHPAGITRQLTRSHVISPLTTQEPIHHGA